MNKKLNIVTYITIILLILVGINAQLFILKKVSKIEILIGLNALVFVLFILFFSTKKIHNILVILYFLPLIYLNNAVHYQLKYELFFALPLFILLFYTFALSMLQPKRERNIEYLSKLIPYFITYYLFLGIWGVAQGYSKEFIVFEGFHFLLFGSVLLFRYHLSSREDYYFIFKALLIISILVSFEYIFLGSIISGARFVTFQSGFLPLVVGILFSFFLLSKKTLTKILFSSLMLVVILAMISTLTRSLWVTTVVTLLAVYILNLWALNKLTLFKKLIVAISFLFVIIFTIQIISQTKPQEALGDSEKIEDRAKSIANPTEDHSFLMRLEMGWYALQKFAEKPLFGWGLGDFLRMQFLGDNKANRMYIDNSWLYFLWKGGLVGFLLIVSIFYRSIKIGLEIIRSTENNYVKSIVIGIIAGIVGIVALGFLSPLIIKYRTNVLFSLLWAYLEFEYNNLHPKKIDTVYEDINNNS